MFVTIAATTTPAPAAFAGFARRCRGAFFRGSLLQSRRGFIARRTLFARRARRSPLLLSLTALSFGTPLMTVALSATPAAIALAARLERR